MVKLFGNVSQGASEAAEGGRSPASATQLMGYEGTRDRCLGAGGMQEWRVGGREVVSAW